MEIKNIITRLALDNLINELGLEETSEKFKLKFSAQVEEKYYLLVDMKLQQELGESKYKQFIDLEESQVDDFLQENSVNLGQIMQDVADFLRIHLEDYQKGVEDFLDENTK